MKSQSAARPRGRLLALLLLSVASAAHAGPSTESGRITATIGPLRNANGSMSCRLYTSPEGFPRTKVGTRDVRVKVRGTSVQCVFDSLKSGVYAVMVHHDENDNRKMDSNLVGMPLEGYGASNNRTYALKAPRWDESRVTIESGKNVDLKIAVRY